MSKWLTHELSVSLTAIEFRTHICTGNCGGLRRNQANRRQIQKYLLFSIS